MSARPPALSHVLETCLYVKSMASAKAFYRDVLGLNPSIESERISVFPLGHTTLLLFQLGLTNDDLHPGLGYTIPKHGPSPPVLRSLSEMPDNFQETAALRQHYCLAVADRSDIERWEEHLRARQVSILGVMDWGRGGRSVYFADPDGHIGEIASRGLWSHY